MEKNMKKEDCLFYVVEYDECSNRKNPYYPDCLEDGGNCPWAKESSKKVSKKGDNKDEGDYPTPVNSALNKQIDGDHYRQLKIQPVEFILANNIPFCEGAVIKYVCRHKTKGGKDDLLKAIHFCEILIKEYYE